MNCIVEYILPWRTIETIDLETNGIKSTIYILNDSGYFSVFLTKADLLNRNNRVECFQKEKELDRFIQNY